MSQPPDPRRSKAPGAEPSSSRRSLGRWTVLFVILAHALGFLSSIAAVMSTRTSQGAIAWAVSLNTFPNVSVPAYWILGRSKFQGYVTAKRADDEASGQISRSIGEVLAPFSGA